MQTLGYKVAASYLLDAQFIQDTPKFFSGVMSALSAMIQLEIPHINVLSKCDLLSESTQSYLDRFALFFSLF